jgi:hypothetical protein
MDKEQFEEAIKPFVKIEVDEDNVNIITYKPLYRTRKSTFLFENLKYHHGVKRSDKTRTKIIKKSGYVTPKGTFNSIKDLLAAYPDKSSGTMYRYLKEQTNGFRYLEEEDETKD